MHQLSHHHYLRFFSCHLCFKREVNGIYLLHSLRGFVFSLFGIFVPIYLLTLGFGIRQILLFYIIKNASVLALNSLSNNLEKRLGLKHTMLISLPFAFAYLSGIYYLKLAPTEILLYSLSVVLGIHVTFYWLPLHSLFSRCTKAGHRSSQVSKLHAFYNFSLMLAPLAGALIAELFGFGVLFLVGIVLLILPSLILLRTKETFPDTPAVKRKNFFLLMLHKRHLILTLLGSVGATTEAFLVPIFVFLSQAETFSVGIVGSLVSVGTILTTLLVGKTANRKNKGFFIAAGALLLSTTWFARYLFQSAFGIYFLSLAAGFFYLIFLIPLEADAYRIAKKIKLEENFFALREIASALGAIIILFIAMLFSDKIDYSFLLSGLSYFLAIFF